MLGFMLVGGSPGSMQDLAEFLNEHDIHFVIEPDSLKGFEEDPPKQGDQPRRATIIIPCDKIEFESTPMTDTWYPDLRIISDTHLLALVDVGEWVGELPRRFHGLIQGIADVIPKGTFIIGSDACYTPDDAIAWSTRTVSEDPYPFLPIHVGSCVYALSIRPLEGSVADVGNSVLSAAMDAASTAAEHLDPIFHWIQFGQ